MQGTAQMTKSRACKLPICSQKHRPSPLALQGLSCTVDSFVPRTGVRPVVDRCRLAALSDPQRLTPVQVRTTGTAVPEHD